MYFEIMGYPLPAAANVRGTFVAAGPQPSVRSALLFFGEREVRTSGQAPCASEASRSDSCRDKFIDRKKGDEFRFAASRRRRQAVE